MWFQGWKEKKKGNTQTLTISDPGTGGEADPFTERLLNFEVTTAVAM